MPTLPTADTGLSPWSFPPERQAIFALSVALRTGDTDGALRAAAVADQGHRGGQGPVEFAGDVALEGAAALTRRLALGAPDREAITWRPGVTGGAGGGRAMDRRHQRLL